MLFFEATTGGGQIGGVNQPHRTRPPRIVIDQRFQQMLINLPQSRDPQTRPELMQHAHVRHSVLAAQTRKSSPVALLRQQFHQKVQRMDRREQAQQVNAKELSGGVLAVPAAGATVGPALIDEIVGHERSQQFEQRGRAGGREVGVHERDPTALNLTRQRHWQPPRF